MTTLVVRLGGRIAAALTGLAALAACAGHSSYSSRPSSPNADDYYGRNAAGLSKSQVRALVVREAERQRVDPAMALAIARAESDFNPRALSPAGARGVMQIMPATARGEFGVAADRLWDPALNVRLGIMFYKQLFNRYGREDIALSHYNGGSRVRTPRGLRVIPATQSYVDRVLRYRMAYARGGVGPKRSRVRLADRAPRTQPRTRPPARAKANDDRAVAACRPVQRYGVVNGRRALLGGYRCEGAGPTYIRDRHVIAYLE